VPSCVPKSKIERMLGCESAATAFASRSNRASVSGSAATDSGRTLIATSRSSFLYRARYTSPIAPAPSGDTISYGPSREPADSAKVGGLYFPRCRQDPLTDVSENVSECGAKKTARNGKMRKWAGSPKTSRNVRKRRGLGLGGLDFARFCLVGTPGFEPGTP